MVSEMAFYVLGLPKVTRREYSFEARLKKPEICSDKQIEKFSTVEFRVNVLSNDPENSEYFRRPPPKGIRTDVVYITDATTADIKADDNGAYNKT